MVELTNKIFKATVINVYKGSKEGRKAINIEIEDIKINHTKLVDMTNKISEIKNSPDRLSSIVDIEEKCSLILKTQGRKLSKMKHKGKKVLKI